MDTPQELEIMKYKYEERIAPEDNMMFIEFPQWLAINKGVYIPANEREKFKEAWSLWGEEFSEFYYA